MKIFIFSTHNLWPNHRETELELMQNHLDKGDEVYRFICNGELGACDTNTSHQLTECLKCTDMRKRGKQLLDGKITELPIIKNSKAVKEKLKAASFNYSSIEEVKKIWVDNFDLGLAVASSVISLFRDPDPDTVVHKEVIDRYLYSSLGVYYSALEYIEKLSPGIVYIFNGRFAHVKPVLRAAQLNNIDCFIHERGYDKFHYELFKNTNPHDRNYILSRMYELWENADPSQRNAVGESFYQERLAGKEQGWQSFTKNQQRGLLPDGWDNDKRNIAIFNSSEDEFASIGPEWQNELYKTQTEGIKKMVGDCIAFTDIHFYLRIHPNLISVINDDKNTLEALSFPNLTIIHADSPISTYDLLFNCEKVIAFGSSVGIEAVYWGKPSIQAGKSFYYDMNTTYKPSLHEELVKMIVDKLEPMDKTPALIYGYYFKNFGIPFRIYKPINLLDGTYKGVNLADSEMIQTRLFKRLRRARLLWRVANRVEKKYQNKRKKLSEYLLA